MTKLENQLAELILETAIGRIAEPLAVASLVGSYNTLILASLNHPDRYKNLSKDELPVIGNDEPVIDADKTTVTEFCKTVVSTLAPPAEEKPSRTRRTKAQIEADKAAEAAEAAANDAGVITDEALAAANSVSADIAALGSELQAEPEAEEVQIDDVEPAAPKITHGKIQELFTLKSTNIAKAGGDVSGFKTRLREMLVEFGSPAGISKLPEANLAAFHAKLVNLT